MFQMIYADGGLFVRKYFPKNLIDSNYLPYGMRILCKEDTEEKEKMILMIMNDDEIIVMKAVVPNRVRRHTHEKIKHVSVFKRHCFIHLFLNRNNV